MDVLSNVPLAFFQGFLLFLIAKIILDISYTKRDYLAILVVIIPSAFLYIYLGSISVLYLLIGCGLILYTKVKLYSLIAVLSSAILMFFSNFLGFLFVVLVENHTQNYAIIFLSYIVIFFTISLVLAFSVQILLKKLMQSYLSINKTYLTIISLVLVLSFIILYVYSQIPNINNSSLKMYGLIFIGIILFFTVLIIFISNYMIKELRYK
ncbi:ATP-binding protein, partial [Staphylococcus haemolyticus]|nr:ATP-binding protein [Staphylococcus haemolyticus]